MQEPFTQLKRQLSFWDAVIIGVTSMIGSGIFVAIVPATAAAGSGVLVGIILAAFVAYCNAQSSARLAALYPESGATYVYARKQLGPFWGWLAGWLFVIGKLASCATAALAFGYYVEPSVAKVLAILAVIVLTLINYFGIKKSTRVSWVIVAAVFFSLLTVVFTSLSGGALDLINLGPIAFHGGVYGILQSAGLMFFAFTGFARIATLAEEVIDPRKNIPLAITTSLILTVLTYLLVTVCVLAVLGPRYIVFSQTPLSDAVAASGYSGLICVVQMGATVATLGVLLSLLLGISRTIFSMGLHGDLNPWFSHVHPRYHVPHRAQILVGIVLIAIIYFGNILSVMTFSAFTILIYYAITNVCALRISNESRSFSRILSLLGVGFCIILALSLPLLSVIQGILVMTFGLCFYAIKKLIQSKKRNN